MDSHDNLTASRKSLFSISVDDVIIHRIFRSFEEEIKRLSSEVSQLKKQLSLMATKDEVHEIDVSVHKLDQRATAISDRLEDSVADLRSNCDNTFSTLEKYVKDEITTATVSVNNVVRAKTELLKEEVYVICKDALEKTSVSGEIKKISVDSKNIKEKVQEIQNFIINFVGKNCDKSLRELVDIMVQRDREKIKENDMQTEQNEKRIDDVEKKIFQIFGADNIILPKYKKPDMDKYESKPKLPKLDSPKCYTDYFEYIMTIVPMIQVLLKAHYHNIIAVSNLVYDKEEREATQVDLEKQLEKVTGLINDVDDIKNNKELFNNVCKQVEDMAVSQAIFSDFMTSMKEFKETVAVKSDVDNQISQSLSDINQEIQILKERQNRIAVANSRINPRQPIVRTTRINFGFNSSRSVPENIRFVNTDQDNKSEPSSSEESGPPDKMDTTSSKPSSSSSPEDEKQKAIYELLNAELPSPPSDSPRSNHSENSNSNVSSSLKLSSRIKGNQLDINPAMAAVKPRGRASYNIIYGEKGRPSTSKLNIRRKEMIEEPGTQLKSTQKTATKVSLPDDAEIPSPDPNNLYYSTKK